MSRSIAQAIRLKYHPQIPVTGKNEAPVAVREWDGTERVATIGAVTVEGVDYGVGRSKRNGDVVWWAVD